MPNLLETLTLSDATKRTEVSDPTTALRRKMVAALDHQIAGATAAIAGQHYFITVEKWVETPPGSGNKERRRVEKAFRKMWYMNAAGDVLLELRFANKPVLISGKPSIVVGAMERLVPTLQTVKKAVLAGELDAALKASLDSRKRSLRSQNSDSQTSKLPLKSSK